MASSMRGLVQFIADLRNARARELEEKRINKELANIRQKFRSEKLDGYQKKKVCLQIALYLYTGLRTLDSATWRQST